MKLLIGLGNPGAEYIGTRHNVGFYMADSIARHYETGAFHPKQKFKSELLDFELANQKIILMKPLTYYNNSGEAVRAVMDFYHIPTHDILVMHDDMALSFATVRVRFSGSDAGNNGVKSINQHIGEQYSRIRIGIGQPKADQEAASFVLEHLSTNQQEILSQVATHVTHLVKQFASGELEAHTTIHA